MSKATVLAYVTTLANGQNDLVTCAEYYDRTVEAMARFPWLTTASLVAITAETSQYTLSSTQAKIIAVFYDDRLLDRMAVKDTEAVFGPAWRDLRGSPVGYVVEDEAAKTFRLVPQPTVTSKNFIFLFGSPFGLDYPLYTVAVIHTEIRVNLPSWLELPVAFQVAAKEYSRESNHRDFKFAEASDKMGAMLLAMVQ